MDSITSAGIYAGYKDGIGVSGLIVFQYGVFRIQFEIRQTTGVRYRVSANSGASWQSWIDV